jgi:hypothetical protein
MLVVVLRSYLPLLNQGDVSEFEKQMRRKVHYVIKPEYLWRSVAELAQTHSDDTRKSSAFIEPLKLSAIAHRILPNACCCSSLIMVSLLLLNLEIIGDNAQKSALCD